MKNYKTLIYLLTFLWHTIIISTLSLEKLKLNNNTKSILTINQTTTQINVKSLNASDTIMSASAYNTEKHDMPITLKPRGFYLPKIRPAQSKHDSTEPAAQNYYADYFPNVPSLDNSQQYFPLSEEPFLAKLLAQHIAQKSPPLTSSDAGILGSGDFGILKGGTFYGNDEIPYDIGNQEEGSDVYFGEASYAHGGPSTESFIQKYTHPEEQFAQFRDFADLNTPAESAFSQYVVVYAAKNSTQQHQINHSKPKNIFEQLQEIDKEKAVEDKKLKKNMTNLSITKLKLVKTKLAKKKLIKNQKTTVLDDDPLIALS